MTDRELLQMALNALEHLQTDVEWQYKSPTRAMLRKVEKALRARLAQPENKFNPDWDAMAVMVEEQQRMAKRVEELEAQLAQPKPWVKTYSGGKPNYTQPIEKEWVGLTENDFAIWKEPAIGILRWAEAVLKEKNAC